jgi:hypothetical protein
LDKERKDIAVQSLMKDILLLAGDQTLEISLLLSPVVSQQQNTQVSLQEQASSGQASEKQSGSLLAKQQRMEATGRNVETM